MKKCRFSSSLIVMDGSHGKASIQNIHTCT